MSDSMRWRTTIEIIEGSFDDEPWALREIFKTSTLFFDRKNNNGKLRLTLFDIPYLCGLKDGGVYGARELIEALEKHQEIEIYFQ